jgi:glycine cleavage system H lipoate-binding protein
MEGFKYIDIFATKGIEYLVTITFLIILIMFWRWLNQSKVAITSAEGTHSNRVSLVDWFKLMDNYYYHQGHSWLHHDKKGVVRIGIDDFAQKLVGKPQKINLPDVGTKIYQGEIGMQVQIEGKNIDFLSPVDGEVIALNHELMQHPELINQEPYEKGWFLEVKSERLGANLKNLLYGTIARAWIEDTVNNLNTSISKNYGIVLQDGGTITNGFVKELAPDNWDILAGEFFLTND